MSAILAASLGKRQITTTIRLHAHQAAIIQEAALGNHLSTVPDLTPIEELREQAPKTQETVCPQDHLAAHTLAEIQATAPIASAPGIMSGMQQGARDHWSLSDRVAGSVQ